MGNVGRCLEFSLFAHSFLQNTSALSVPAQLISGQKRERDGHVQAGSI